ncbi:MAG: tyrosine--tRNA ligase [Phycisphaerales bacterium]|jgi:tyrosyl-tRNA synthetase|nr:tyrosine--tRNA ligase [Planctomycetaceae bacterium]MDP6157395.1 tyrosine--tRNA ligase [Phycisphaerales bacterium]MDP6311845.1 tyrosine--tRNA ligase [Phycisphaerales bacterium]MDP7086351.1 tyrosine--tRNA ligase [Phycisphaerales bacterium]MDP7189363.1 tyrosine--tRNA ligase [Phycisphaerales bacterium]|tara:strand:- start:388 stop:1701 length:1314 start_codon:yes stop_codon:yes gene_type:complete
MSAHFLDELRWRGMLHQTTADEALPAYLAGGMRTCYCGFDPTSTSLTIGNLVPMMLLARWQRCGHKPIVLCGGGTGLIGDPSGKEAERSLQTREQVQANVAAQKQIFSRVIDFDSGADNAAIMVDNADWLGKLGYLDVLRDVGKYFSVNTMIQKDSVRERLHNREQGISYTEFSYMLLQAYDFLHLRTSYDCTVQMAGSDQYGNIVSGIDLIRRHMADAPEGEPRGYGITAPLITKADGTKFGKTETGTVWLTADRTSPWAFYQFWLNASDEDAGRFLRIYTFLDQSTIEDLETRHAAAPHERISQHMLASELTCMMHGADELARVEAAAAALFGGGVRDLEEDMLEAVFADVESSNHNRTALDGGVPLAELLADTGLAKSRREAREFLKAGSVSVNGEKISGQEAVDRSLAAADLLHGHTILLRRGKKAWHCTRWS